MLFVLLFLVVEGLDCPVPEDRRNAWYSGKQCNSIDSCCFNEVIDVNPSSNGTSTTCCYAYGTAGPIKCCGFDETRKIPFIVVMSVAFGGLVITAILLAVLYGLRKRWRQPPVTIMSPVERTGFDQLSDDDIVVSLDESPSLSSD